MRTGSLILLTLALAGAAPAAFAQGAVSDRMTRTREYDQEHLGSAGLQKCSAFQRVQAHSAAMQAADHGRLTPGDTRRLTAELTRARHLPPARLTPAACGVPL